MGLFGSRRSPKIITTTQQQSSTPWKEQEPHLKFAFDEAKKIYKSKLPQYFPKPTVVELSPDSKQALEKKTKRSLTGSVVNNLSKDYIEAILKGEGFNTNPTQNLFKGTAEGEFLGKNPASRNMEKIAKYKGTDKENLIKDIGNKISKKEVNKYIFDKFNIEKESIYKRYFDEILPKLDAQFSKMGRYGSNAHLEARKKTEEVMNKHLKDLTVDLFVYSYEKQREKELQDTQNLIHLINSNIEQQLAANNMISNNYTIERTNQLNASHRLSSQYEFEKQTQNLAAKIAPLIAQQDYYDIAQLASVGAMRETYAQAQLNDEVDRWNAKNSLNANKLAQYLGLVGGGYGGESMSTQTQPHYNNNNDSISSIQAVLLKGLLDTN